MAFRTDTRGDREFEQSMRNAIALLEGLEKQARTSDKAVQEFGKTMDDLSKQLSKIQKDGGKFTVPTLPGSLQAGRTLTLLKRRQHLINWQSKVRHSLVRQTKVLLGLQALLVQQCR